MGDHLKDKFANLGVEFSQVLIPDVKLPYGITKMRENITTQKKSKDLKEKDFEFTLKKLSDESTLLEQKISQQDSEMIITIRAEQEQALITRDLEKASVGEARQNAVISAQETQRVSEINTKADLEQ